MRQKAGNEDFDVTMVTMRCYNSAGVCELVVSTILSKVASFLTSKA